MASNNDGSSSGEEREIRKPLATLAEVTPSPMHPASINTIMARFAQQDAAQKAATEQIAALAKILGPIAANMEASTAQIRRQLFNTAPTTGATRARPDVQDTFRDEAAQTSDDLLTQTLVGHNVPNPGGFDVQTLNELAALKQSVLEINKQIHHATTSAPQIDQVLAESLPTPFTQTITKVRL